ncbi:glycosyltransferase family 9 protein [candidate division KSB1 bacterium]
MRNIDKTKIKKIMILGSIGIGNLLLFSQTLKAVKKEFQNAHFTFIVLKESFKQLYEHSPDVDEIMIVEKKLYPGVRGKIKLIFELRKKKFDLSITTFPANRFEYNLLPFLSGAKRRIAHKYNRKTLTSLSFLQNHRVPVDYTIHDLDQNLNLLKELNIDFTGERKLHIDITQENQKEAEQFLEKNGLKNKDIIVGFHPGSSVERGMIMKQWEKEKYAELAHSIVSKYEATVLVFGGNDEEELKTYIEESAGKGVLKVSGISLMDTAALIGNCSLFISNDSGLMHIAVGMDVKTIALFGPSDPLRTAPHGVKHIVIRTGIECSPCWSIHNLGVGVVRCVHSKNLCMKEITVNRVFQDVEKALS